MMKSESKKAKRMNEKWVFLLFWKTKLEQSIFVVKIVSGNEYIPCAIPTIDLWNQTIIYIVYSCKILNFLHNFFLFIFSLLIWQLIHTHYMQFRFFHNHFSLLSHQSVGILFNNCLNISSLYQFKHPIYLIIRINPLFVHNN